MKTAFLVLLVATTAATSDVSWTRFTGRVKAVDQKASRVTIQNKEGDLVGVKVDDDVTVYIGKDPHRLKDVNIDDKVTLVYMPKAKVDTDEPQNGVYSPASR